MLHFRAGTQTQRWVKDRDVCVEQDNHKMAVFAVSIKCG